MMKILTHNVILTAEFERQSRDRIQQSAENSRKFVIKETAEQVIPDQNRILGKDWLKQLSTKTAD
jgi:phosphoribosylaminoimidazole carboxylase (NCAIR synthetase)